MFSIQFTASNRSPSRYRGRAGEWCGEWSLWTSTSWATTPIRPASLPPHCSSRPAPTPTSTSSLRKSCRCSGRGGSVSLHCSEPCFQHVLINLEPAVLPGPALEAGAQGTGRGRQPHHRPGRRPPALDPARGPAHLRPLQGRRGRAEGEGNIAAFSWIHVILLSLRKDCCLSTFPTRRVFVSFSSKE